MKRIGFIGTALVSVLVTFMACNNTQAPPKMREPIVIATPYDSPSISNSGDKGSADEILSLAKEKTTDDLLAAFRSESTAAAKYAAFSKRADKDGYHQVALLFKAASTTEIIHASNHNAVLDESGVKVAPVNPEYTVKTTRENLQEAIKCERYEASTMYPELLKDAEESGSQLAVLSLTYALKVEKKYQRLYENALIATDNLRTKELASEYYICPTCGNTFEVKPSQRCGVCMTDSGKFIKIIGL